MYFYAIGIDYVQHSIKVLMRNVIKFGTQLWLLYTKGLLVCQVSDLKYEFEQSSVLHCLVFIIHLWCTKLCFVLYIHKLYKPQCICVYQS